MYIIIPKFSNLIFKGVSKNATFLRNIFSFKLNQLQLLALQG